MTSVAAILIASLAVAQPNDDLRLSRGQELHYRGAYVETATHGDAEYRRSFDLEIRVFVIDVRQTDTEIAICTTLKAAGASAAAAVRFELATVDRRGRVRLASGESPPFLPDKPPSLECAGFVERPTAAVSSWTTSDSPPIAWRMAGIEVLHGVRCIELAGTQQSDGWERQSPGQAVWRRVETAWVGSGRGIVEKLKRELEWRRFGERDSIVRSLTEYELHGGVSSYPDALARDRWSEIGHAARFQTELRRLLAVRGDPSRFDALIARIDRVISETPATPYRAAIVQLRQSAVAGQRGETVPP